MSAHAHQGVVGLRCHFALGGLRRAQGAGSGEDQIRIPRHQQRQDPDTSTYHISPGDLDEGITALLVFRGEGDVERQGAGWARVKAFRQGVIDEAVSCVNYEDK